jgi:hypothetical protein
LPTFSIWSIKHQTKITWFALFGHKTELSNFDPLNIKHKTNSLLHWTHKNELAKFFKWCTLRKYACNMGPQVQESWSLQGMPIKGNEGSYILPWIKNDSWPIQVCKYFVVKVSFKFGLYYSLQNLILICIGQDVLEVICLTLNTCAMYKTQHNNQQLEPHPLIINHIPLMMRRIMRYLKHGT